MKNRVMKVKISKYGDIVDVYRFGKDFKRYRPKNIRAVKSLLSRCSHEEIKNTFVPFKPFKRKELTENQAAAIAHFVVWGNFGDWSNQCAKSLMSYGFVLFANGVWSVSEKAIELSKDAIDRERKEREQREAEVKRVWLVSEKIKQLVASHYPKIVLDNGVVVVNSSEGNFRGYFGPVNNGEKIGLSRGFLYENIDTLIVELQDMKQRMELGKSIWEEANKNV